MRASAARSALDLAGVSAVLVATWWVLVPRALDGRAPLVAVALVGVLVAAHVAWLSPRHVHRDPPERHGVGPLRTAWVRREHAGASLRFAAAVTLAGTAALLAWGWAFGPRGLTPPWRAAVAFKAASYLPSAALQATLFFEFYLVRYRDLLGPRPAVAAAAATFAFFHLPNGPLALLALLAGLAWGHEYLRRPNLVPLVASHALLGTVATQVVHISNRGGPFLARADHYLVRELLPWWGALADRFLPRIGGG